MASRLAVETIVLIDAWICLRRCRTELRILFGVPLLLEILLPGRGRGATVPSIDRAKGPLSRPSGGVNRIRNTVVPFRQPDAETRRHGQTRRRVTHPLWARRPPQISHAIRTP